MKINKIISTTVILALISVSYAQGAADNSAGLAALGKGLAIGLAALGAGVAQSRIGGSAVGAIAEDDSKFGTMLILLVIPETLVVFGLLSFFLI